MPARSILKISINEILTFLIIFKIIVKQINYELCSANGFKNKPLTAGQDSKMPCPFKCDNKFFRRFKIFQYQTNENVFSTTSYQTASASFHFVTDVITLFSHFCFSTTRLKYSPLLKSHAQYTLYLKSLKWLKLLCQYLDVKLIMPQLHVKMHLMHTKPEKLFGFELAPNLEHIISNSLTKI